MNVKELKRHIFNGLVRPEYFYIPLHEKQKDPDAFIYIVDVSQIAISFNQTYQHYYTADFKDDAQQLEYHHLMYDYLDCIIDCIVDWGDGTQAVINAVKGIGAVTDNGVETEFDGSDWSHTFGKLEHEYSDSGEHTITIFGKVSQMSLGGYPIEIVQWGNLRMDDITDLVVSNTTDAPCTQRFKIPDAPMSGVENVTHIYRIFYQTAIASIPDDFFKNYENIIDMSYVFDNCAELTVLGNNLCKNLRKLSCVYGLANYCSALTTIGDSIFENCTNIGRYTRMTYNCHHDYLADTATARGINFLRDTTTENGVYVFMHCPIYKIGDYLFKGCTGIHSLVPLDIMIQNITMSAQPSGNHAYYSPENFYYITDSWNSRKKVTLGKGTFSGCTELKTIDYMFYGTNITFFPADTFEGCTKVVSGMFAFGEMNVPVNFEKGIFKDFENLISISRWCSGSVLETVPEFPVSPIKYMYYSFLNGNGKLFQGAVVRDGEELLPALSGNNFYTNSPAKDSTNITAENVMDYIGTFSYHELDCSNMFGAADIKGGMGAFYTVNYLTKYEGNLQCNYNNIWVGNMPGWWSALPDRQFTQGALIGCMGISNFDTITVEQQNRYQICEYSRYDDSESNTEFHRRYGARLISEY